MTDPVRSERRLQRADGESERTYTFYPPMQVWGALSVMLAVLAAIPFLRFLYFLMHGSAESYVLPFVGGLVMFALAVLLYIVGLRVTAVGWNRRLPRLSDDDLSYQTHDEPPVRRGDERDALAELETAREQTERNIRAA